MERNIIRFLDYRIKWGYGIKYIISRPGINRLAQWKGDTPFITHLDIMFWSEDISHFGCLIKAIPEPI